MDQIEEDKVRQLKEKVAIAVYDLNHAYSTGDNVGVVHAIEKLRELSKKED